MPNESLDADGYDEYEPARYRNSHCTECERTFPINMLTKVQVKEVSGSSSGSSRNVPTYVDMAAGRPFRGGKTRRSSRIYYRNVTKRLCATCYEDFKSRQTQLFFWQIGGGALAFVAFIAITAVSATQKPGNTVTTPQLRNTERAVSSPVDAHQVDAFQPTSPTIFDTPPIAARPRLSAQPAELMATVIAFSNVRQAPSLSGAMVGTLQAGDRLAIISMEGPWAHVKRQGNVIGWIHRNNLAMPANDPFR